MMFNGEGYVMNKTDRIKELVNILNEASKAYYQQDREIMSNFEYDRLYDELVALEEETGIRLSGSPTARVGYEILSELPKEAHAAPMLPLVSGLEIKKEYYRGSLTGLRLCLPMKTERL